MSEYEYDNSSWRLFTILMGRDGPWSESSKPDKYPDPEFALVAGGDRLDFVGRYLANPFVEANSTGRMGDHCCPERGSCADLRTTQKQVISHIMSVTASVDAVEDVVANEVNYQPPDRGKSGFALGETG